MTSNIPVPSSTSVHRKSIYSTYTKAGSNLSLNSQKSSALPRRRALSLSPQNGRRSLQATTPTDLGAPSTISMNSKQSGSSFRSLLPRPKNASNEKNGANWKHNQSSIKSGQETASLPDTGSNGPSFSNMNCISEDTMTLSNEPQKDKKLPSATPVSVVDDDVAKKLTRLFISKRRGFLKMKRELIAQQKAVLDVYASLKGLDKKVKELGLNVSLSSPSESLLEEMQVVDVGTWSGLDLRLLTHDELEPKLQDLPSEFGCIVLREMSVRLMGVPEQVAALCNDMLTQQRDHLNILRSRVISDKSASDNWKKYLGDIFLKTDQLEGRVNGVVASLRVKMDHVLSLTKTAWKDRDHLIKKLENIKQELHATQRKLKEGGDAQDQVAAAAAARAVQERDNTALEEVRAQLARERSQRESLKAVVSNADAALRVARARIVELEQQLKDSQTELEQARRKQKDLELQIRHRESSFEVRFNKLKGASKSGEATIETLTKQRDSLEIRVKELNEQLESAAEEASRRCMEERARCASLEAERTQQQLAFKDLEERLRAADAQLKNAQRTWEEIHVRCDRLMQLHEERRANLLPQESVSKASDREVELWKELQTTRMTLGRLKEDARKARRDKEQFLQQIDKIAQNESSDNLRVKFAEEFIEKERAYDKLQDIVSKLQKNEEMHEQRESMYESQIADLKLQVLRLQNDNVSTNRLPEDALQMQVVELQMEISKLRSERAELQSAAAASELLLERHQRATELQRHALRLRDELIQILNTRAPLSPESLSSIDHHKLVSLSESEFPTSECPQKWSLLQQERARRRMLERMLRAQHDQLQRETRERTRLEEIKAQLERKLNHLSP